MTKTIKSIANAIYRFFYEYSTIIFVLFVLVAFLSLSIYGIVCLYRYLDSLLIVRLVA